MVRRQQANYVIICRLLEEKLREISRGEEIPKFLRERREDTFEMHAKRGSRHLFEKLAWCIMGARQKSESLRKRERQIEEALYNYDYNRLARLNEQQKGSLRRKLAIMTSYKKKTAYILGAAEEFVRIEDEYGGVVEFIRLLEEHPEDLVAVLRSRFKGLGPALARDFVKDVGMNMIKPDSQIVKVMGRLGLISSSKYNSDTFKETLLVANEMADALGERLSLIDGLFWLYGADTDDKYTLKNICSTKKPICAECSLRKYCRYPKKVR